MSYRKGMKGTFRQSCFFLAVWLIWIDKYSLMSHDLIIDNKIVKDTQTATLKMSGKNITL